MSSKKRGQYYMLGLVLMQTDPERAKKIISIYINPEPRFHDYSLIPLFFYSFCKIRGIDPDKFQGPLFKTSMTDTRRLFISSMIRLYNPQIYNQPNNCILVRKGFSQAMAKLLGLAGSNMSKTIRDCVMQEKLYDNIKNQVSEIVERLEKSEADLLEKYL